MTDIEIAWQAKAHEVATLSNADYLNGIEDFKSSLKREIEKQQHIIESSTELDPEEKLFVVAGFLKCLELLNTVEP